MRYGVFGIVGLGIAFNLFDCAYRIHQLAMDRSPVAPGAGFSPTVLRIAGLVLGSLSAISCVHELTA
ncbi:hypothetical protein DRB96_08280 [Streptomyces sp. ICC1]|nr:hypothetical protein DRB89_09065 [Streptomyces sp. ICC4]AWZ17815.1 hypothetical protein DRB96_08280 [Streptomyces sp. ICC1]